MIYAFGRKSVYDKRFTSLDLSQQYWIFIKIDLVVATHYFESNFTCNKYIWQSIIFARMNIVFVMRGLKQTFEHWTHKY